MRNEQRTASGPPPPGTGPDALDLAIDDALRDLMAVDAGPSFAARVLARAGRHPIRRWSWGAGGGLAAAAATVVALVLWPPAETERPPAAAVRDTAAPRTPDPPASSAMAPEAHAAVAAVTPWPAPRPADGDRTRPAGLDAASPGAVEPPSGFAPDSIVTEHLRVEIPPLARLDPIGIEPLTAAPIEPAAITIVPLAAIPAIGTAPLSPPVERD